MTSNQDSLDLEALLPTFDYSVFLSPGSAEKSFRELLSLSSPAKTDLPLIKVLFTAVTSSADPDQALTYTFRLAESLTPTGNLFSLYKSEPNAVNILTTLFAGSKFLSDFLLSKTELLEWLLQPETLQSARSANYYYDGITATLQGIDDVALQRSALTIWRRKEMLRIACRDLLRYADAEEISRDISDLAQSLIAISAQISYKNLSLRYGIPMGESIYGEEDSSFQQDDSSTFDPHALETGMCVLGMGKLGGRELNFSSDIDLIFVYDAEGETTGRMDGTRRVAVISNHVFFTKMGEAIVKFLGERGPDGNFFRVDMRLRPEGQDGPLARSLESFITYLNSQARDWERIAYLKARVMCGPKSLESKLYRVISSFVFSGVDAQRIVSEVQQLKMRIDREVIHSDLYHREVKRGYGGIREIEFVIAAMQIIHGNSHHALRVRNTFLAIQRLREVHILSVEEERFYFRAYEFLRNVEHRLQMDQELQTHTLPNPGPDFEAFAKRSSFPDGAAFQTRYELLTDEVHKRFAAFFEQDLDALEQETKDILLILDRSAPEEEALAALERRGLTGAQSLRLIHSLVYGNREVFVSAEGQRFFEQMLPALLRVASSAPFPEQVLPRLNSFVLSIKGITYYYEVITNHPDILKLLVTLFGTSEILSSYIISRPEFFDALISTRVLNEKKPSRETRESRLNFALSVKSLQRQQLMLRRAVNFERLLIGLQLLLKLQNLPACLQALTDTADISMGLAMKIALRKITDRINEKSDVGQISVETIADFVEQHFQILAFGKYGGRELNFFGDLDVVFFYKPTALPQELLSVFTSDQEFFNYLSDILITVMSETAQDGRVFMVDARLRPHGRNAPIAVSADTYAAYIRHNADVWELQSFTRARTVWGCQHDSLDRIYEAFVERLNSIAPEETCTQIVEMKNRLSDHAPKGFDFEIKRSNGGIVDIEFLIQWWLLNGNLPINPGNVNYFSALEHVNHIGEADKARLKKHYHFLRYLENILRIVYGSSEATYNINSSSASGIARCTGFGSPEELVSAVNEIMKQVNGIVEKFLRV